MLIRLGGRQPVIVGWFYMDPGETREVPAGLVDLLRERGVALTVVDVAPAPTAMQPSRVVDWNDFGDLGKSIHLVRLLERNGYATPLAVVEASDDELLAINGIGPKGLAALREILGRAYG
jgi:hypothetical protein